MNMFCGIRRAFGQLGVDVVGWPTLLDEPAMAAFMDDMRPDAVLEMNRWREKSPAVPSEIPHICWMVDSANQPLSDVRGSEITYFFGANWLARYPHRHGSYCDWLAPGVDERHFHPEDVAPNCDLAFIGHMPRPWAPSELARALPVAGATRYTFADVVDRCSRLWPQIDLRGFSNDDFLTSAWSHALGQSRPPPPDLDATLRYDISCRLVRLINRRRLLDLALTSDATFDIYGSKNFEHYPEYAPHYRGFVADPGGQRRVYRGARINLHEGVGVHFRSLDCMACGALLLVLRGPDDSAFGGIETQFEPGVDYVGARASDFADTVRDLLSDHERRRRIALAGHRRIRAHHTWVHRARKILDDLKAVGAPSPSSRAP